MGPVAMLQRQHEAAAVLVVAQHRETVARQRVGHNEKWLVASNGFVAIVRTGAGDEHNHGKWPRGARSGQRPREGDVGLGIGKRYVFFDVRIGLRRILRAADFQRLILSHKNQFLRHVGLRPGAGDGVFGEIDGSFVGPAHTGNFKIHRGFFLRHFAGGKTADALIETVQRGHQLFFVVVRNVQLQTQAQPGCFQRALPRSF